jgi:hypothetical protein
MWNGDTNFGPPALLGLSFSGWIALGLASLLLWGWIATLAWRIVG